jgi:MFS family permease
VHRLSSASGAGRTGLNSLIELTAAGSAGDAFVAVSLAGTIFFSTSLDQARGKVALFLLVTMAPFAVLAPFIGPMLDRMQQGRRFILAGTLLARGLLCWGMSGAAAHKDSVTLLPAAFGVLVLQKVYGVARSSVAPRLLPAEITLVTANARSGLASLIASTIAAPLAAGVDYAFGAAWVLRLGTVIYLAAVVLSFRLPDQVDAPPAPEAVPARPGLPRETRGPAGTLPLTASGPRQPPRPSRPPPGGAAPTGRTADGRRRRTLGDIGPVVVEAMRGNATLRAFSGFMIFFLAFLLRTDHFHGVTHNVALGAMVGAAAAGGLAGTAIGSGLRARAPHLIVFGMLVLATVITALCAWFFGLWTALVVAFVAALGQSLAKLALDAIVQREIGEEIRSSAFAVSETLNQLSWVAGGLAGLLVSFTDSGTAGLAIAATGLAAALFTLTARRRRRLQEARHPALQTP